MNVRPYTVATLAEHWGVSTTFVYDEINRGNLRHMRFGAKLIRIPADAVAEYERCATGTPQPAFEPPANETASSASTMARLSRLSSGP